MEGLEQVNALPRSPDAPLRVLILSDGRPGHFNQSKGVLRALQFHHRIETEWCELHLRSAALRPILTGLLNYSPKVPDPARLGFFYQVDQLPHPTPDLIVSAGGNTLHANAWLARAFSCRNLFIGDPRKLGPHCFWRVLTYRERQPSPPFIHWEITPVPILPEEITAEGQRFREAEALHGAPLWTLLIGGDGGGYRYQREDWEHLIAGMRRLSARHGIRWLTVTSRRSGDIVESMLATLEHDPMIARLSLYTRDRGARYRDFLGAGDRVVATEDSHMMLTEAISAGRPVLSLRPREARPDWTNQLFFDSYSREGYLQRAAIVELEDDQFDWTPTDQTFQSPLRELGQQLSRWLQTEAA
ncbi:MAG: hypothetical protein DWH91_02085 [Planctomycetota bacterium]|nr:MAG: hypothetical protein DWH91_02085 [Planctomycetota bacterium]